MASPARAALSVPDTPERSVRAAFGQVRPFYVPVRLDGLVNIYSYPGRAPVIVVYAATAIGGSMCIDEECLESAEFDEASIPWDRLAFRSTHEALHEFLRRS